MSNHHHQHDSRCNKQIQLTHGFSRNLSAVTMEDEIEYWNDFPEDLFRKFRLLIKGFCSNTIEACADMQAERRRNRNQITRKVKITAGNKGDTTKVLKKNETADTSLLENPRNNNPQQPLRETAATAKQGVPATEQDTTEEGDEDQEQQELPFELEERPPTDVVGNLKAWKAILDHWYGSHYPPLKGFCDHYYHTIFHDDSNPPPGGEECSVGSVTSNVIDDISTTPLPQPSPRHSTNAQPVRNRQLFQAASSTAVCAEKIIEEEEEEEEIRLEEDILMVEYPSVRPRAPEIFLATLVAVILTFLLVESLGTNTNYQRNIQFSLQTKPPKATRGRQQKPNVLLNRKL